VTRRGGMTTSAGGEVTLRRGKGGDYVRWVDANFIGLKNK
jgi:hypothetical protein